MCIMYTELPQQMEKINKQLVYSICKRAMDKGFIQHYESPWPSNSDTVFDKIADNYVLHNIDPVYDYVMFGDKRIEEVQGFVKALNESRVPKYEHKKAICAYLFSIYIDIYATKEKYDIAQEEGTIT